MNITEEMLRAGLDAFWKAYGSNLSQIAGPLEEAFDAMLNAAPVRELNRKGFEEWAVSEGRSIKPASEYSPQVYASTPSNNALAGWLGRQPAFDALETKNRRLTDDLEAMDMDSKTLWDEIAALKTERDELVRALRALYKDILDEFSYYPDPLGIESILAKYPETPTS